MTEEQAELLLEARDSVAAARVLLANGFVGYAAARAYYAMFYVAEAFLEGEGLAFSKHSGVVSGFHYHFVRTGKVPREFHRHLVDAQDLRLKGDYGDRDSVTYEQALMQIERAEQFLALAQGLIGPIPENRKQA
ncbi:MAG: HEPN domain-containing protein [Anaerolineae bacterium]